jgi:hypothetical protein
VNSIIEDGRESVSVGHRQSARVFAVSAPICAGVVQHRLLGCIQNVIKFRVSMVILLLVLVNSYEIVINQKLLDFVIR